MALDLSSALAKTGRAADHLNALADDVSARRLHQVYRLAGNVNADRTKFRFTLDVLEELPFQEWSLVIGDCVSNLRSSLDHLIYAIAIHESKVSPPINENLLMFPICDTDTAFAASRVQKSIGNLSLRVRTAIESMQPYKRSHETLPPLLSILRDFDNTNKHKLLRLAYASPIKIEIQTLPFCPGALFKTRVNHSELKHGTEVVMTIMAIAGHVSRRMLEHYSRIRTDAKREALDAIAEGPKQAIFGIGVHQNVHQLESDVSDASAKPLN